MPTGFYDENLVVQETEQWLSELDGYAHDVLKPFEPLPEFFARAKEVVRTEGGRVELCLFPSFDSEMLKLFFLSVLWRFAASQTPQSGKLDIGPHIDDLRQTLAQRDLSVGPQFEVTVFKLSDGDVMPVMTPSLTRVDGIRMVQMVFGGFSAHVKCDRRSSPSGMKSLALRVGEPVTVPVWEFKKTKSYANTAKAALHTAKRFGSPWKGRFDR